MDEKASAQPLSLEDSQLIKETLCRAATQQPAVSPTGLTELADSLIAAFERVSRSASLSGH